MEKVKKKLAIYPGTFNPFTIGHLNILEKAEKIFGAENVVILVGDNPDKLDSNIDRAATIKFNLPSKKVDKFKGFLTDYIFDKEKEGFEVYVIRGLRNGSDLDYEVNTLRYLEDRKHVINTVFLICDKEFEHVSSSGYRACEKIQPGSGHYYLAKELPTVVEVSSKECVVFVDEDELINTDKYKICSKNHLTNESYLKDNKITGKEPKFSGSYVECLTWVKEQETKK